MAGRTWRRRSRCGPITWRRRPSAPTRPATSLAQLALVLANQLGDRAAAGKTLSRLMRAMGPGDARRVEIQAALDALAVS